jgi:hypothetical protein
MFRQKSGVAAVVAGMVFMNSVAFAGGQSVLQSEVKNLRAQIDVGQVDPRDAIDVFAKSIADKNVTVADVDAYVKSRVSAREYRAFRQQIEASLAGIDAEQVSASELGEVVGHALRQLGSEGLSWSSCATTWTGVGLAVAAVIVGIFALVKNKSDAKIKQEYASSRSGTTSTAESRIQLREHWKTAIPEKLKDERARLARASAEADVYEDLYEQERIYGDGSTESQQRLTEYSNRRQSAQYSASDAARTISQLESLFSRYTANPDLAFVDIAEIRAQLEVDLTRLTAEEAAALARAPSERRLAGQLGIGAGIGAAAGTYLIVRGAQAGACD